MLHYYLCFKKIKFCSVTHTGQAAARRAPWAGRGRGWWPGTPAPPPRPPDPGWSGWSSPGGRRPLNSGTRCCYSWPPVRGCSPGSWCPAAAPRSSTRRPGGWGARPGPRTPAAAPRPPPAEHQSGESRQREAELKQNSNSLCKYQENFPKLGQLSNTLHYNKNKRLVLFLEV